MCVFFFLFETVRPRGGGVVMVAIVRGGGGIVVVELEPVAA